MPRVVTRPLPSPNDDLGFGTVLAPGPHNHLLNRDGTYNVRRVGLRFWESQSAYHYLLAVSWPRFLALLAIAFTGINALFALAYVACGPHALHRSDGLHPGGFGQAFFFSIHTLATIGYGNVSPANLRSETLVAVESFLGVLGVALVTGLVFARFARPGARVLFSGVAVVAPFRGGRAFMFRVINARVAELTEVHLTVSLSRREVRDGAERRTFHELTLERESITMFPLNWTLVHVIDESSPLHGWTEEQLTAAGAEVLVLLTAFEETFSQTVHVRGSYRADQIRFGSRFLPMHTDAGPDAPLTVDLRRLDAVEAADLP